MNKRTAKKWQKKSRVPKSLLRLVAKYSSIHRDYDRIGELGQYLVVGETDTGHLSVENVEFFEIMPQKSKEQIHALCKKLYLATKSIVEPEWEPEYENGFSGHQCNYRITKKPKGEYVPCFVERNGEEYEVQGYYVWQVTKFEDDYEGSIYLPLNNGKYLAYDYAM